jgi:chaperone BCS1
VVVIEDIDSAGIGREQGPAAMPVLPSDMSGYDHLMGISAAAPSLEEIRRKRNTVTLSGLLNAIDGNASQEGRLLIMTSNRPDALDAAITRPGRIDKKVYFGNMSKTAGKSIFMRLIGRSALAHDAAYTMAQIEQYANEFAERVPANTFTPAQVQNFLQGCRSDPLRALREVDVWVVENRQTSNPSSTADSSEMSASFVSHSAEPDPTRKQ